MENEEESKRLDIKTDPEHVHKQARWCGVRPGLSILDVGCGSGKTTSILNEIAQPGGFTLGLDLSEDRISYAKEHFGKRPGIDFQVRNFTETIDDLGQFDIIWVRFVLEYFRVESLDILRNLTHNLKEDGSLCLLDLDYNCLSHYEIPDEMENTIHEFMQRLERFHNFDPYAGRKLYSYLYDLGYRKIGVNLMAHHLIYGKVKPEDEFNWIKKLEVSSKKIMDLFDKYQGGYEGFSSDFREFFHNPRRFTYTPVIMAKGMKPA